MTKQKLGLAAMAGIIGCAACCAVPLLAAAGVGGGAAAGFAALVGPGAELIAGLIVGAMAFAGLWLWQRRPSRVPCGPSCRVDGSCCEQKP